MRTWALQLLLHHLCDSEGGKHLCDHLITGDSACCPDNSQCSDVCTHVGSVQLADAGPYFYLPKMQSHKEARLWNDVFVEAQDLLNIPRGTIKVS